MSNARNNNASPSRTAKSVALADGISDPFALRKSAKEDAKKRLAQLELACAGLTIAEVRAAVRAYREVSDALR